MQGGRFNSSRSHSGGQDTNFRGPSGSYDSVSLVPISTGIDYRAECEVFRRFVVSFTSIGEPSISHFKVGYEPTAALANERNDIPAVDFDVSEVSLNLKNNTKVTKYMMMLQEVADYERSSIVLELEDLAAFLKVLIENEDENAIPNLVSNITGNVHRYINLFSEVLDSLIPTSSKTTDMSQMDVVDVIVSHRRAKRSTTDQDDNSEIEPSRQDTVPAALTRRFSLFIKPLTSSNLISVRQLSASLVGSLIRLKGIVTRIGEVRPLLTVGTYTCEQCGFEVYQEVGTTNFSPLPACPTPQCAQAGSRGQLTLQTRGSRFLKFQEGRIQELADQVPVGHIPRSTSIVMTSDLCRLVHPGEHVILSGIFMPRPYTGFKAIRAGLLTDTYIYATHVELIKSNSHSSTNVSDDVIEQIKSHDPYGRLASSIAPEIFGHIDIKKALLLLMVGGVTRSMEDGMRIRGDINICLMGDPGVAKSQLLKWICGAAPRAVYTTGRGSSGVGLTAAVSKDPVTGEMILEGGALVLADHGICCIDEFDKMDDSDRTAIHEVMEQQTISISKAGITTTLNARTSILAAANPLHGRYNPRKSPRDNINLPPALLSRFDLLFLVLDLPNRENDERLAEHICYVHRTKEAPSVSKEASELISPAVFRSYVERARQIEPVVPSGLVEYIVGAYVGLRSADQDQKVS